MSSEHTHRDQIRRYDRQSSVVFLKTKEAFGGLSNMASGFPLEVNGIHILTSEALYQACRFPHMPDIQQQIIDQRSPMTAKMKSKPHRDRTRPDWDRVRVAIMRWCLRVKLAQNWIDFGELLMETGDRPIVEQSRKDDFWGAKVEDNDTLVGINVLGRLLMELRECLKHDPQETLLRVEPPKIPEFLLAGEPIGVIGADIDEPAKPSEETAAAAPRHVTNDFPADSLFAGIQHRPAEPEIAKPAACRAGVEPGQPPTGGGGMIADCPAYSVYVETGLPWIPMMPAHWDLVRNRAMWRRRKKLVGSRHPEYTLLSLTKRGVIVRDLTGNRGKFSADMGTSQEVRAGDFVFCLFDVPETPRTVGLSRYHGMITGAYTVLESIRPDSSHYLERLYCSLDTHKALSPLYSGLRNTIPVDRFLGTKSPLPPPEEQAAIVRFLAEADRRINRLIRNKRRLIELLNEQKQAIITQAVTRGLDPSVPMRASGIADLPEIPAPWGTKRAKYLFREIDSRSRDGRETHLSMSQRLGLVPSSMLTERHFHSASYAGGKLVEIGDIVLNRLKAHLGVFAVAHEPGVISPDYTVLRPHKGVDAEFYCMLLKSPALRPELRRRAKGLVEGFWRLYTDDFYDMRLPVPSANEQEDIVRGVRELTSDVDTTLARMTEEIELIREYHTRLISDVVTGKLDVRAAAADLPDPADTEPEPADALDDDADLDAAAEELNEEVAS